jgi:putative DNA methylase
MPVTPFVLKDSPALIEHLVPVQKLSMEAFKEQMAGTGKALTALGSYWKGRKPLILNKACILGCLLPVSGDSVKDLEIFEMLMGMDDISIQKRLGLEAAPPASASGLVDRAVSRLNEKKRGELLDEHGVPHSRYKTLVAAASRPEEIIDKLHDHIWPMVNKHLGTDARSLPELVEQLGMMRFGHRPRFADTFSGSGQIPFEAARLGCDVYASDLNPIACMLTWGAFNIVGSSAEAREQLEKDQKELVTKVQAEIDRLDVETDGKGWRGKAYLYCVEVRCPQTGWLVPLLPTLVVSMTRKVIARLVPDAANKRYAIEIVTGVTKSELDAAKVGTLRRDSKYEEAYLLHEVLGKPYKTLISTIRADREESNGTISNALRKWEAGDIAARPDDILQERLYCIQWAKPKSTAKSEQYEFRSVTADDHNREKRVTEYVAANLRSWQEAGHVPNMRIEVGGPPRYQGLDLIRARGWTNWLHVFNPRQLLLAALFNKYSNAYSKLGLTRILNQSSRLSRWDGSPGSDKVQGAFDTQALNTIYNFGARGSQYAGDLLLASPKHFPLPATEHVVRNQAACDVEASADIFITDPPYGDAVKYEEILEFFIAWLRKNPPSEFADWVWDSRRAIAIKGEDEAFRQGMVAAYKRMTECMPDNGIQVIMFTHQSGSIWADMANIVWASGLHVTAAWYVVTETDSALREGSFVKGTVLLVLRKRTGALKVTRDDLAWEIEEEVQKQVQGLTGLNQTAKSFYRDENVFEDADIQMAGYAAALRVLTRYSRIDGREMATEAVRPRVRGEVTFVDELIEFAVATANQCLVPQGIEKAHWDRLTGAERFYLKMLDMESRGSRTLDNYQNFAKAFKVRDYLAVLASRKANEARLKSAAEFGKTEMGEGSQLYGSPLRAVLYAMWEIGKEVDGDDAVRHLAINIPDYYSNQSVRELADALCAYLVKHLEVLRPEEASSARVLSQLIKNQRIG